MNLRHAAASFALALSFTAPAALADDVDPAGLYELSTEGSTKELKAGESGKFVLQITAKGDAHVSDEAPMKIELSAKHVQIAKQKLALADSVTKKAEGEKYANPRFEVPVTAAAAGQGSVDAKVTFFICTDKICARQQKSVSVPVAVK